jgi:serine/threonine protein kinase
MNDATDPADRDEDFIAGWLLAWKTFLTAGAPVPDLAGIDLPTELSGRLRRGAECLCRLHEVWPTRPATVAAGIMSAPPAVELLDSPSPRSIGRFRVRGELGRGGFGVVYLAHDPVLDREVAVKVPLAATEFDSRVGHRFAVEAQAAARLSHVNIVPVHESGTADGLPYLVSDFCHGISLADWLLQTNESVPWQDAARLVASVAAGVHHAHARGVLHRDLKPANVLLALADTGSGPVTETKPGVGPFPLTAYIPRVTDFGLARFLMESRGPHTASGLVPGTPAYMAPEQAVGGQGDITIAADVYSLGAILYELLVLRPPFAADTPLATLEKVRTETPVAPRELRPGLPPDLETVCLKCLNKEPARRYASADELAADLGRALRGEPILARRSGRLERFGRSVLRHPAIASLSALLTLSLVCGLVVATVLWQRTRRERDRAERHLAQVLEVNEQTAILTTNDFELRTDEMRPLRQKLVTESAERFARLTSQLSDDPADRRLLARCYLQLGALLFEAGRAGEAHVAAARAVESYERLSREHPDDPGMRYGFAVALMRLAYAEADPVLRQRTIDRAEEAHTAFLALPEDVRGPAADREAAFASFHYDMAVIESSRPDRVAARRYLKSACDRLRPLCANDSSARERVLPVLAHALQFRCQIERIGGWPTEAVASGREALASAQEVCRQRPGSLQSWKELAGTYNEYGLALQAAGQQQRAIEVWKEGYERLGDDRALRAIGGTPGAIARFGFARLMIAYNLALGSVRPPRFDVAESERWFRASMEQARMLLFVLPNEQQVWYMHGMCCANLCDRDRGRGGRPIGRLPLHSEGLASLEAALRMRPDDQQLRSDLGLCWHRFAADLAEAQGPVVALVALAHAIVHQFAAVSAKPDRLEYRDRLRSHLTKYAAWVTHPVLSQPAGSLALGR